MRPSPLLLLAWLGPAWARQAGHGHHNKLHRKTKFARQPHVVFILADDLGYNDVPWHNPTVQAPNLADLAKQGVILEQNYVQPKCAPSRAALMTGVNRFWGPLSLLKIQLDHIWC
jgi:hypothetical protein